MWMYHHSSAVKGGGEAIDMVGLISMREMGAKIQATNASGYHINICSDNNILLED